MTTPPLEVLIVEDSATQRELLRHVLEEHGYQVALAGNGLEALARLQTTKPTTVISDILMPGMDGYELCRRIKADARLNDLPVILLTALSDPKDVLEGLECGADNFIVKPYDEAYLLSRLEYILANRNFHQREHSDLGVEIVFAGQHYFIHSQRRQILDLLLSTYEAVARKNAELEKAREALKTANAELEQRVRERTARLQEVNQSLESFSYSIAHDLRSPLRAIQGYTSMLFERYSSAYDEEARQTSQRVMAAARQMDQLIKDLLAYGEISQIELSLRPLSLETQLDGVLEQLRRDLDQRQAQVQVDRPLPAVQANDQVLQQVLLNLLSNALKFSRDNVPPKIHIWAEPYKGAGQGIRESVSETTAPVPSQAPPLTGSLTPSWVRLHIQDNGIGIDPAYCERIFGLFQRLHASGKYPGTGIGLVIVRKGIERMGGRVGVDSRPGAGACFWIELPSASPHG